MQKLQGFEDDFGRLTEAAIWQGKLCCRGADGGYVLYTPHEWNATAAADYEADANGHVSFQGCLTGDVLPEAVRAAAVQ